MAHYRHRKFHTKDTYPEQKQDNDLAQAVVAKGGTTIFLRGQCPQDLDTAKNIDSHDPVEQTHKVMQNIRQLLGGIMAAREVLTSASGADVHLLDWTSPPTVIGGGDAFGDDDQVFSGCALSHDAKPAFIGDSNFGGNNRVAIVGVGATEITPITVIGNITDPSGIATSPFGHVALVTSSQPPAEGIYVLDKGGPGGAWRKRGALAYVDGAAQLPGDVAMIERGQLAGRVLVSELSRVRQVAFRASGAVDDVGSLKLPDGLEQICGAIGVTP